MDHSSPQNDFGNAKSQAAKKALLAGHVTFSKELWGGGGGSIQFQYHNNGKQGPLQKSNHVRRIYFSTIFHCTLLARGPDSAARPDYFETMHSISVIYALNCRSRKRSFGGKFPDSIRKESLSNYDDDHNDDFKKTIVLMIKTIALHVPHAF